MAISFDDLGSSAGLKSLDEYLLKRSYISGCQASRDDLLVYLALAGAPSPDLINLSRWYSHITGLIESSFPGSPVGVSLKGGAAPAPAAPATRDVPPPAPQTPVAAADDDDLDLFGEETEEEQTAAAEREAKVKASAKKKESGKSSVLMDVKPWDDETDMVKLEAAVRAVQMPGLLWGASKLTPVGYGIKKLTIMMTVEDELVSVDGLIEEHLTEGPAAEYIQSCDIVAFNKI
ncbi:elongation factor 1-delta [Selaginella moellendorffii]|uniref:elongation factor 1-delta n=1 Tax=Selaginella moellendorffii TaxID=88036 RepID=UPI000D1CCFE7|nr:elongation factor 1-delta [Selaginella moellendorffii]|eukprot:XP_024520624.1 elongation factor 1-delta [Selaginella moellendorffii]